MRRGMLLFLILLGASPAVAKEESEPFPLSPTEWLVIAPVDHRSRRPFNPDAVFERYLHSRKSGMPHEGDTLTGERGREEAWKKATADEKGRLGGKIAWAYTHFQLDEARVVIAKLSRAARLFVNGTPTAGAVYGGGFQGFPVHLRKGRNDVFVRGVRGKFKLTFEEPPAPVFIAPWSRRLPDLVEGEGIDTMAGVYVINAQDKELSHVQVLVEPSSHFAKTVSRLQTNILPLGVRQVRVPLRGKAGVRAPAKPDPLELKVRIATTKRVDTIPLKVRKPDQSILRTFVSRIDDSVQVYGVRRPEPVEKRERPMGLVLSLHGAGVNPRGQANAYSPKPDFWHICPTNRAPFGFDWQDWGRTDAYEVLADALTHTGVDRSRVYLTGHSMGGHGTWHLAANDPDGFAAIAPSAGWISFDTYGGRRKGPLTDLWHAADAASDTHGLIENLAQLPTYIVHGTKDDNVPITEARTMEKLLTEAGAKPEVHYAKDKGHWWNGDAAKGADCVDWPGVFDLFRTKAIPRLPDVIRFRTVDPAVDSTHHWIRVYRPIRYGEPCSVHAVWEPELRTATIETTNVAALVLKHPGIPQHVVLDGRKLVPSQREATWFVRGADGQWHYTTGHRVALEGGKRPDHTGPFKRAFGNRFVLVYGTTGTEEENRELLERARYEASAWCYRANGQTRVLSDRLYLSSREALAGGNVILYGNRDTNAAYEVLLKSAPIQVWRGRVRRDESFPRGSGDDEIWMGTELAAMFVHPHPDGGLVGVFADTGTGGTRLGYPLTTFVSGVGYPDYVLFDARILTDGDGGVLAAGWFDARWRIQAGGYVRKRTGVK